ncbi:MAG: hypothetical protein JW881_03410 [Spirochaetales bacterium]|nr:hypothetical protein [Spirochaetales bacterium]
MGRKGLFIGIILVVCLAPLCFGQLREGKSPDNREENPNTLSLFLSPAFEIPIGSSSEYFDLGGSALIGLEYGFTSNPVLFAGGGIRYNFAPIKAERSVSLVGAEGIGGMYFYLLPRLAAKVYGSGGYYYGFFNDAMELSSNNFFASGGLGLSYVVTPSLNLYLNGSYAYFMGLRLHEMNVSLGVSYYLTGLDKRKKSLQGPATILPEYLEGYKKPEPGRGIELSGLDLQEVFPVFFKYYDDHPVGKVTLRNKEGGSVSSIKVGFLIRQYMDAAKQCPAPSELAGGESKEIELFSLFTDKVLDITEGTKVTAEVQLEYFMNDEWYRDVQTATLRMYDRNAMTWDDDRKAAAFVTAKDPKVLALAKNVAGMVRERGSRSVNANLRTAMAIHNALDLYGLHYVVDPRTPYKEFSKKSKAIDFLQFPRQSLEYKAGDCDDLSILYCSLLEAAGIETAFITVPGHILMAFSTDIPEGDASRHFSHTEDLLLKFGKIWIPVEVTERSGGFLKAWQEGAGQWREYEQKKQAAFYPLHEAWNQYEPVGLPGGNADLRLPEDEKIVGSFQEEMLKFIDREIYPMVAELEEDIKKSGGSHVKRNKLGILYAKYGLLDKAEAEFAKVLDELEYVPSLVNMGNIHYFNEEWDKALAFYDRALKREPSNATVLLSVARTYHQMEDYALAKKTYDKLRKIDSGLAKRYAYIDMSGATTERASDITKIKEEVLWIEE